MNLEKIAGLIKLVEESSLTEFSYKDTDVKISMSKLDNPPVIAGGAAPVLASAGAVAPAAEVSLETEDEDEEFITSPIVGTFYSAAAPDIPAFVRVGDHVKSGQTVCILEAMKLMNEIESDFDGTVAEICVENGESVEYGKILFRII